MSPSFVLRQAGDDFFSLFMAIRAQLPGRRQVDYEKEDSTDYSRETNQDSFKASLGYGLGVFEI